MTLSPYEYNRIQQLLAMQRGGYLGFSEEQELRALLGKQNPSAGSMTTEELVKLGLFLVGLYALFKIFSK